MKEDIKDILWLVVMATVLYLLSNPSAFKIFQFLLRYGMRFFAYVFIFFAIVGIVNLAKENIFKKKEKEEQK